MYIFNFKITNFKKIIKISLFNLKFDWNKYKKFNTSLVLIIQIKNPSKFLGGDKLIVTIMVTKF